MKRFPTILLLTVSFSAFGQFEKPPLLLFDGLYETECYIEKGDNEGSQDYLRFYSNGKIISVDTDCEGTVSELKNWFNLHAEQASIGTYKINGRSIEFSTTSKTGVVNYKGRIIDRETLKLKWKSLINGNKGKVRYKFVKISDLS